MSRSRTANMSAVALLALAAALLMLKVVRMGPGRLESLAAESEVPADPSDSMDVVTYCRVRGLRQDLCLTDADLAAMGHTEESAARVLQCLLQWYQANRGQLESVERAEAAALSDLGNVIKASSMGIAGASQGSQIATLNAALAEAIKQRRTVLDGARATVESVLTADQKAIWATARANVAAAGDYRYVPDLTPDQQHQILRALRARDRLLATATATEQEHRINEEFRSAQSRILSGGQATALGDRRAAIESNMAGVIRASRAVLPVPRVLQPPVLSNPKARREAWEREMAGNPELP